MCSDCGKTSPVAIISVAPAISRLRRSYRGAMRPTASVNSAVPNKAAAATRPICAALKPIAAR